MNKKLINKGFIPSLIISIIGLFVTINLKSFYIDSIQIFINTRLVSHMIDIFTIFFFLITCTSILGILSHKKKRKKIERISRQLLLFSIYVAPLQLVILSITAFMLHPDNFLNSTLRIRLSLTPIIIFITLFLVGTRDTTHKYISVIKNTKDF